jgi:hypothetical protein
MPKNIDYIVNKETGCWEWQKCTTKEGYGRIGRNGKHKKAHRVYYEKYIGPIPEGIKLDHICHNPSCINPEHLRLANDSQNCMNKQKFRGSSKYKGVSWNKRLSKWEAQIQLNKKKTYLGMFSSEEAAANAYDSKALELFGEFAWTNFKQEKEF